METNISVLTNYNKMREEKEKMTETKIFHSEKINNKYIRTVSKAQHVITSKKNTHFTSVTKRNFPSVIKY